MHLNAWRLCKISSLFFHLSNTSERDWSCTGLEREVVKDLTRFWACTLAYEANCRKKHVKMATGQCLHFGQNTLLFKDGFTQAETNNYVEQTSRR